MVMGYYTGFQTLILFASCIKLYKGYVRNTTVVFDGGYELSSTKTQPTYEELRGEKVIKCVSINNT